MNYELAQKIKDAGFPQYGEGPFYCKSSGQDVYLRENKDIDYAADNEETFYVPTLEELIEACGYSFYELLKLGDKKWYAGTKLDDLARHGHGTGPTPTEAVAYLYLSLQRSKIDK